MASDVMVPPVRTRALISSGLRTLAKTAFRSSMALSLTSNTSSAIADALIAPITKASASTNVWDADGGLMNALPEIRFVIFLIHLAGRFAGLNRGTRQVWAFQLLTPILNVATRKFKDWYLR